MGVLGPLGGPWDEVVWGPLGEPCGRCYKTGRFFWGGGDLYTVYVGSIWVGYKMGSPTRRV